MGDGSRRLPYAASFGFPSADTILMGISVSSVSAGIFSGQYDGSGSLCTDRIQPVEVYGFGGRLNGVPGAPSPRCITAPARSLLPFAS